MLKLPKIIISEDSFPYHKASSPYTMFKNLDCAKYFIAFFLPPIAFFKFKSIANFAFTIWKQKHKQESEETYVWKLTRLDSGHYKCLLCLKSFAKISTGRRHHQEMHAKLTKNYICSFCGKCFNIKRYLQNHLNFTHGITQKMLKNSVS